MNTELFYIAIGLAVVAKALVDGLAKPLKERYPTLDTWWLIYVAWAIAAALVFASGFNLFDRWVYNEMLGRAVTAVVVGGGSNLIHDVVSALRGRGDEP